MPIENNIKQLRTEQKLTLTELAESVGLKNMWKLEKGDHYPLLDNAYKIAKILGVSVYDIWPDIFTVQEEIITIRKVVCK